MSGNGIPGSGITTSPGAGKLGNCASIGGKLPGLTDGGLANSFSVVSINSRCRFLAFFALIWNYLFRTQLSVLATLKAFPLLPQP